MSVHIKMILTFTLFVIILAAFIKTAKAEDERPPGTVFLYLPDSVSKYRTRDQGAFVEYIATIVTETLPSELSNIESEAISGAIIITLRPKNESKIWYKITSGNLSDDQKQNIESAIKNLDTPEVFGIMPAAITFHINGAPDNTITTHPIAPEWVIPEVQKSTEITLIIEKAWNAEAPQTYDPYAQIATLPFSNVQISPIIPPHVTYKTTDDETNKRAYEKIKTLLGAHLHDFSSLTDVTMLGTFLSQKISAKPDYTEKLTPYRTSLPFGDKLKVTTQSLMSKSTEQATHLAYILSNEIHIQPDATIRKATDKELALIWFFIGWDIQEPLYIVEDKTHKYAFDFTPDGENIFWLEDIKEPCMRLGQGSENLTPCMCIEFTDDYRPIFRNSEESCS